MINIDFLEYIVEFSKTNNLTKASEKLLVSQSALTRAMKKVETSVNVPLFTRSGNKLTLNDTGKIFVKYAEKVIEAERQMIEETVNFHNAASRVSIGLTAIGPILKYGTNIHQIFCGKPVLMKEDSIQNLLNGLSRGSYDFIFTNKEIEAENMISIFAFTEKLYASLPKNHCLPKAATYITFAELDGLTFLVADNLGIWENIIRKHMPKSKFLAQNLENLSELINASTIPNFSTNITIPLYPSDNRINLPIIDEEASVDFYITFRKKDKEKLADLLKVIMRNP